MSHGFTIVRGQIRDNKIYPGYSYANWTFLFILSYYFVCKFCILFSPFRSFVLEVLCEVFSNSNCCYFVYFVGSVLVFCASCMSISFISSSSLWPVSPFLCHLGSNVEMSTFSATIRASVIAMKAGKPIYCTLRITRHAQFRANTAFCFKPTIAI